MEYKDTLNLPKTGFSMKANLPDKEPTILKSWKDGKIYEGIVKKRKASGRKFILHDGPPYSNGDIHMGHALNKILKDIVVKFNAMMDFEVPFIPGWDCHGLPVEHQLMKDLKIEKGDIPQVEFRKKAKAYALKYVDIQRSQFERLGIFGDWDHPYLTLKPEYEAAIVRSFAALVGKGFIYKDLKPVNWCYGCETALAEAEVEYEMHRSPSVYVKFAIDDPEKFKSLISENGSIKKIIGRDVNVLIWTTTPWTLVSNVAIALSPEMRYALVEMRGELLVIAYDLLVTVSGKLGIARPEPLAVFPGRKLEGLLCRHPFIERLSGIVLADYVSREEGTGCVHTAPGHGQEDYITGRKYDLPTVMPVDSKGRFDETAGQFKGLHVFDANAEILRHLEKIGALMHSEDIEHSYPHCWRCKNPIIFRATWQYFMKVDHAGLRSKVSNEIKSNVRWIPEIGKDRIGAMVDNRPDWCLSRQRLWGVPIVAFYCKACGALLLDSDVINSVADIFETEGSDCWFSRVVSELIPNGTKCKKCGGSEFEKETDILDVWFESGVSHQAVLKSRREFPADLYLEGSDQHRGWFQSAIISSMAIENSAPYRSVLTHGFVVDGEGKKMSKSVGNVISPQDVMKKYGADILRIWVASCDYRDDIRISAEILSRLADAYRKIRNTARYILGNIHDYDVTKNKVPYEEISSIDKWALWRASNLLDSAESNFRNYSFHRVFYSLYNFCVVDMSSIYLDVLKDTLYIHGKDSVSRRGAQTVLYDILAIMTKIMAPILAYTAEEVWRAIPNNDNSESIHLKDWPDNAKLKSTLSNIFTTRDTGIWDDFLLPLRQGVLKVLENARGEGLIGSSLEAKVILYASEDPWIGLIKEHSDMLNKLFIVSSVAINDRKIEGAVAIDEVPVSIKVEKADGQKCLRCWNYSTSVRKENGHPSLCSRCAEVVKTMSK